MLTYFHLRLKKTFPHNILYFYFDFFKESSCSSGDLGSIPGLERSSGEGNGYPLQYSGQENSMDCLVHGVTKESDRTEQLSLYQKIFFFLIHKWKCPAHLISNFCFRIMAYSSNFTSTLQNNIQQLCCAVVLSRVQLFAIPWTIVHQAPLSMEFSRQEYWSGLSFPTPGDLPNPGIEPGSPASQMDSLPAELPGKPI